MDLVTVKFAEGKSIMTNPDLEHDKLMAQIECAVTETMRLASEACSRSDEKSTLRDIDDEYCVGNERFLHHWFSTALSGWLQNQKTGYRLIPEARTRMAFHRDSSSIFTENSEKTASAFEPKSDNPDSQVGPTRGSLDFRIESCDRKPCAAIEFKGPEATTLLDLIKDMMKLLSESETRSAVFVSALCDHRKLPYHWPGWLPGLAEKVAGDMLHVYRQAYSIRFARQVAEILKNKDRIEHIPSLYVYSLSNTVAELKARDALSNTSSADDRGKAGIIHWGPFTGGKEVGTPLEQAYYALENPSQKPSS